ncbi:MAG: hypothetical protein HRT44_05365 [Bdellovibrionales bacterium]|nr:hypothetical protein [Bdellovibrionales bacterium]NQZ18671.1 hypothetical protein [Bdellovibrionales bacterium]
MKILVLFLTTMSLSYFAKGNYDTELKVSLQEALMQSNADYNEHKLDSFGEEFERLDDWGSRDEGAIMINKDFGEMEAENYKAEENQSDADWTQEVSKL